MMIAWKTIFVHYAQKLQMVFLKYSFVMIRRGLAFILILHVLTDVALADVKDTVIAINEVVAKGVRFDRHFIGATIITIDSLQRESYELLSLTDLLLAQPAATVTMYGPGGQGGVKFRGGDSDHTTVVWNGFNIKPPMSGELNFSTLSAGMFDQISIQPGGSSTMYGNGAATGVLLLTNNLKFNNTGLSLSLGTNAGSYQNLGSKVNLKYSTKKVATKLAISGNFAENNYLYTAGNRTETLQNAAYRSYSVAQQVAVRLSNKSRIESDIWWNNHFKQIPSLISNTKPGTSENTGNNIRVAVNYAWYHAKGSLKVRSGYFNDQIYYLSKDPVFGYESNNESTSWINEIESGYALTNHLKINLGGNFTSQNAYSESYTKKSGREVSAIFGRLQGDLLNKRIQSSMEFRQEHLGTEFIPVIYSLGTKVLLTEKIAIKGQANKLYSLPDMNDLFWAEDGFSRGNPLLKPENGWSTEGGIQYNINRQGLRLNNSATLFLTRLSDAIIWLPSGADGVWMPDNYQGFESHGLEYNGNASFKLGAFKTCINYGYTYTKAQVLGENNQVEQKQKRYVPKHQGNLFLHISRKNIAFSAQNTWVGERLIDEVSLPLKPYYLLDLAWYYSFKLTRQKLKASIKIKNVLNTQYVILNGYAQPPITYNFGLNYTFQ